MRWYENKIAPYDNLLEGWEEKRYRFHTIALTPKKKSPIYKTQQKRKGTRSCHRKRLRVIIIHFEQLYRSNSVKKFKIVRSVMRKFLNILASTVKIDENKIWHLHEKCPPFFWSTKIAYCYFGLLFDLLKFEVDIWFSSILTIEAWPFENSLL